MQWGQGVRVRQVIAATVVMVLVLFSYDVAHAAAAPPSDPALRLDPGTPRTSKPPPPPHEITSA